MKTLNVNKAEFIRSAASPRQFIRTSVPSVVFAGKSNVGKSSVINRLLNRKNFADRWGKLMEDFFSEPSLISLGVMIVDARHKPTADDVTMADWFKNAGCRWLVVANKTDKLKKSEIEPNLRLIRESLSLPEELLLIPFSAEKGSGREDLMTQILQLI